MVRIPLPFRGVAVLLLAASTVVGQTPEPPAEFLALDPSAPPDFLRQFSADTRHPLLALMADGELAALETASTQDSAKLKPTPKAPAAPAKTEPADGALVDGCQDGCLLDGCPLGTLCPTVPNLLPFACAPPPPPCCCRKCQRKCSHGHRCGGCGYGPGYGSGYGNPYLNWPTCPAWCFYGAPLVPGYDGCCGRRCGHKRCCGGPGYGCPYDGWYGGGWNMMGGAGFWDGGCGSWGCCMPPPCSCRKCHKHQHNRCCGYSGYGHPYGGAWGWGYGGYWDGGFCGGCMPPPPPPQCGCRKCQRKHGCSYGCGYPGYGYPGWGGCGMASAYAACMVPCYEGCYGCGKHRCGHGRGHRCHGCQQPYPYCPYPMGMPCMGAGPFCADGAFGGDGFVGNGFVGDGFVGDGFVGDGAVGMVLDGTTN